MSYKIHFINANAGSGKTTFLVNKIVEHTKLQRLDSVLCLTFSNAGVQELLLRVYNRWQDQPQSKGAWNDKLAQTLHSFCLDLLLKHNDNYKILTPDVKEILWEKSLNETILELKENTPEIFDDLKQLQLIEKYSVKSYKGKLGEVQKIAKTKFLHYKTIECWLDFDDILVHAKALLESDIANDVIYDTLRGISCLMIDEAQDLSQIQWEIIHLLVQELVQLPQISIYVVGDEKQTIYGFQGASSESMELFKKYHARVISSGETDNQKESSTLLDKENSSDNIQSQLSNHSGNNFVEERFDHSYRCSKEILNLVDKVFGTKHISKNNDKGYVEFWGLELEEEIWMQKIADQIKALHDKDIPDSIPYSEMMILIRKRNERYDRLFEFLQGQGIPVAYESHTHLMGFLYHFCMMCVSDKNANDNFYSYHVLTSPLIINNLVGRTILKAENILQFINAEKYIDILYKNEELKNLYMDCIELRDKPVHVVKQILEWLLERNCIQIELMGDLIDSLALYITNVNANLYSCAHFLKNYRLSQKAEMVKIQTVHSVKGQEAKVVFLCDTTSNPNLAPLDQVSDDEHILLDDDANYDKHKEALRYKGLKEHNRLLYVALTRAKTHLYIVNFSSTEKVSENSWYHALKLAIDTIPLDNSDSR